MRRLIGLSLFGCLLVSLAVASPAQRASDTFTFLHVSNAFTRANGGSEALRTLAEEAAQMPTPPAFVVDTGNVTEFGSVEELARAKEALSPLERANIRYYAVPGERDVRWSAQGKEGFTRAFGKGYQSFDSHGIHFVLLDATVMLQPWGHLDKAQLEWLDRDLRRIRADMPVMIFLHYGLKGDAPGIRPIDNEFVLYPPMQLRNIVAIFVGDEEQDETWKINGVTSVCSRGLRKGAYHRITVTPLMATIERVELGTGAAVKVAGLPLTQRYKPSLMRSGWDDANVSIAVRRRPMVTLQPRAVTDLPDNESAEYRINNGDWLPMQRDARDMWRDVFLTKDIPIGVHSAAVRLTTSNKVSYQDELIFEVEREDTECLRRWAVDLDGPIQSSPLLDGETLYVSCLDGRVYALNTQNGRRRWTFTAKGAQFLASPVLANDLLYVGGTDGSLYAINAQNGKQKWKFDTGSPVLATAAVTAGVVCLGSIKQILGIDADNGKRLWTQPAGSFFQARAAADTNTFYLAGWDATLRALDARTGEPRWIAPLRAPAAGQEAEFNPVQSAAIAAPFTDGKRVYVCTRNGELQAYNVRTGAREWAVRAPAGGDPFSTSSPVVLGLTLYIAGTGERGDVYALNTVNGQLVWRSSTGQAIWESSPRLSPRGESLAIMSVRGRVSVLATETGKRLWGYELGPGNIFSTPEYNGTVVYAVTMANDVQALLAPKAYRQALPPRT